MITCVRVEQCVPLWLFFSDTAFGPLFSFELSIAFASPTPRIDLSRRRCRIAPQGEVDARPLLDRRTAAPPRGLVHSVGARCLAAAETHVDRCMRCRPLPQAHRDPSIHAMRARSVQPDSRDALFFTSIRVTDGAGHRKRSKTHTCVPHFPYSPRVGPTERTRFD